MKRTNFSIAVVLLNPDNREEVLAVKRPADDDSLPNVWGFPATTVDKGELPEDVVKRIGREKLSTDIIPVSYIGIKRIEREDYELILMEIEASLKGKNPSVENSKTEGTKYVDQQWTSDYDIFKEAAVKGSLCSRVFLESRGISWN